MIKKTNKCAQPWLAHVHGSQRLSTAVVPKVGCTAPWGVLEVSLFERIVHLFIVEVTLDQTLGNWYHFIKPIHHIKNLLTVK
jgi:hypothetical protein